MIRCRSHSSVWTVRARAQLGAVLACIYLGVHSFALAAAPDTHLDRVEALFQEGLQLAAAGKTDAAIGTFSRLTRDYPRLWQPHAQLAALYVRTGELAKAILPLQTALRLESNLPALQEQLGDLYVQLAAQAYAEATPARATAGEKAVLLRGAVRGTQSSKDVGAR